MNISHKTEKQIVCLENKDTREHFFTVRFREGGLGDRLTQLSRLYRIGSALSYTYVHTPFTCARSRTLTRIDKLIKRIDQLFKKFFGLQITSDKDPTDDRIIKFLGLDRHDLNINDEHFSNYQVVEICLDKIFKQNEISEISQLKRLIEVSSPSSEPMIYSFSWTKEMRQINSSISSKLDHLLNGANKGMNSLRPLKLPEKYWKSRRAQPIDLPFEEGKIKVTVHLRKGDRACINLDGKVISVFGGSVKLIDGTENPDTSNYKTLKSHRNLKNYVSTSKVYAILERIFSRYGEENFSVILISDGFERTFHNIRFAAKKGKIKLNANELKQLNIIEDQHNKEFEIFAKNQNVSTIIGESDENLLRSIHAVVCADIVIRTSGYFALRLHELFKQPEQSSIIINANEWNDNTVEEIGAKIARLSLN